MRTNDSEKIVAGKRDETILILAPTGRDAELTAKFLEEAELPAFICANIEELCEKILENAGIVFLTGEVLTSETVPCLLETLSEQPAWSDIPLIILTSGGSQIPTNVESLAALSETGNVTLIERPVRLMTMMSAVKSALRARRRQYDIRDYITEQKRTAAELAQLYESELSARSDAQAANRLKDDFLATVSHELRTPLNAMLGWVSLMQRGDLDADAIAHALDVIERNARSQAQIIEDLLDVSRIITGKLTLNIEPFSIAALVESVIHSVQPAAAARGITVKQNIGENIDSISGDAARVQQILWNLLTNAIKFTPHGGSIEIKLEREETTLAISVIDSGKGISAEFLPFVFDRFRQAESATTRYYGGLGLGLAIVRHLVELHGGTVHADSEGAGKGATFTVRIPFASVPQTIVKPSTNGKAHKENIAAAVHSNLNGLKILIVDDEIDALEMIKIFLENSGAKVTAANSVPEALETLKGSVPDIIISDIGMPGTNGYQFIETVRAMSPERGGTTPAVALTAYARNEDVERALRAGYQKHIAKPIELNKLARTVADVAGRA